MTDNKVVFCDTGFVIRLLDETNELHENALGYFRYLPMPKASECMTF